ncbi:MAG: BrnT family toxin, partial [Pseudohongiella sp.]|nr:BrnT family toxin [Pseudohongiella sp.]
PYLSPCLRMIDNIYIYMHTRPIKFIWDHAKRESNLRKHGLDFADAHRVFAGPMAVYEDISQDYGEPRTIGVGFLDSIVVLVVHVESDEIIRIISMRRADKNEADLFFEEFGL